MKMIQKESLTTSQQEAYSMIMDRIEAKERYTTLKGYAGTGKTYLIGKIVDEISKKYMIAVCAPTHKAAQVLRTKMKDTGAMTIHRFLGLKLVHDNKGGNILKSDPMKMGYAEIVIIDESSMIGENLWEYINEASDDIRWIFVGDPAQLPPVNEKECPIFSFPGCELKEIVRQAADNPIIQMSAEVRKGNPYLNMARKDGERGIILTQDRNQFITGAIKNFKTDEFQEDCSIFRLLAYRNTIVNDYNKIIRTALYGVNAKRFVRGEWLIAKETWCQNKTSIINNSEEVKIIKAEETTISSFIGDWKVWNLKIKNIEDTECKYLSVLHESEESRFWAEMENLKIIARQNFRQWHRFYELKEMFAEIDYAYAMTVHKSQGSTMRTIYVDHRDLNICKNEERQALIYVAVTRPSEKLVILI